MQGKTGVIPAIIIGLIIIVITVAVFFVIEVEKTTLHYSALLFLLLSEFALFSGLVGLQFLGSKHSKVFMRSGITVTLILYFVVTLISIVFTNAFEGKNSSFVLLEVVIVAIFAIITVIIFAFSRGIAGEDNRIVEARGFMDVCEKKVYNLMADAQNKDYAAPLKSVYEGLKYSDKIGMSSVDSKIDESIDKLEAFLGSNEKNREEIMTALDEVSSLIKRRKAEISESKRGGF